VADLDVTHLPGRRATSLGVYRDIASDGYCALSDCGDPDTGEVSKQTAKLIRCSLLVLAFQALQRSLKSGLPGRFLPDSHPLHLIWSGRLQSGRSTIESLKRDLLQTGVPSGEPLRDPPPEPGPGIGAGSLHHRRSPSSRQRSQRLCQQVTTPLPNGFVICDGTALRSFLPVLACDTNPTLILIRHQPFTCRLFETPPYLREYDLDRLRARRLIEIAK
jgi:hypothetical protein